MEEEEEGRMEEEEREEGEKERKPNFADKKFMDTQTFLRKINGSNHHRRKSLVFASPLDLVLAEGVSPKETDGYQNACCSSVCQARPCHLATRGL